MKRVKISDWGGYWSSTNRSIAKVILDFMRRRYFNNVVISIIGNVDYKTVLEAGCGTSESLVSLSKYSTKIVGLDNSIPAIELSKTNFEKNGVSRDRYTLVQGTILSLPFSDNSFDIVFNAGVIEHFKNNCPIKEMIRVAKPGGAVLIIVPANGLYRYAFKILTFFASKDEFSWELHKFYDKNMLEKELLESGAKKIRVFRSVRSLGVYMVGVVGK